MQRIRPKNLRKRILSFQEARKGVGSKKYTGISKRNLKLQRGVRYDISKGSSYKTQEKLKKALKVFIIAILCISITSVVTVIGVVNAYSQNLPDINLSTKKSDDESLESIIADRNGKELYRLRGDKLKEPVKLSEVPKKLQWAFIAAEDAEFFEHKGLNLIGTTRALICVFKHADIKECGGGSSITQQLIKATTDNNERSVDRKIQEAILAMQFEKNHSKEDILEKYLNMVPEGGILEGVKAGSKYLFGKESMNDLTLAEMAYLASIANEPTVLSPWGSTSFNSQKSFERANYVLDRMLQVKDKSGVTEEEVAEAKKQVPLVSFRSKDVPKKAPHYVDYVLNELNKLFVNKKGANGSGSDFLRDQGYTIITAADLDSQTLAEETVKKQIKTSEFQKTVGAQNAAVVIMDPRNGEVLAMVGSRDFYEQSNDPRFKPEDNAALRPRSLGSTNKPPLYLTAFRMGYDLGTLVPDEKLDLRAPGAVDKYIVENYSRKYGEYGNPITMRTALMYSLNVPAVTTFHMVGRDSYVDTYLKLTGWKGVYDSIKYPSSPLGAANIPLLEQVHAYATMASEGTYYPTKTILEIRDKNGNVVYNNRQNQGKQVIDKKFMFLINDMNKHYWLFDNDPLLKKIATKTDIAGKTGTGDNGDGSTSDVAFMAYTPTRVMGMWAGNSCSSNKCPLGGREPTGEKLYSLMFKPLLDAYSSKLDPGRFSTPDGVIKKNGCDLPKKENTENNNDSNKCIPRAADWTALPPYDSYLGEKRDILAIIAAAKKQRTDNKE